MRYLKYTYVDAVTGVPVTQEPVRNGPVPPAVDGLEFGFALESEYPTLTPTFFGTCPNEANTDLPGVLDELTEDEYQSAMDSEMEARRGITLKKIDAERDRRIAAGFVFQGNLYQTARQTDRENILGAAQSALAAIVNGAQPGDLRWADPEDDFFWIASDNSRTPMDAQTTLAFSQGAIDYKTALIVAASNLKSMESIPVDYADDKWWPV